MLPSPSVQLGLHRGDPGAQCFGVPGDRLHGLLHLAQARVRFTHERVAARSEGLDLVRLNHAIRVPTGLSRGEGIG